MPRLKLSLASLYSPRRGNADKEGRGPVSWFLDKRSIFKGVVSSELCIEEIVPVIWLWSSRSSSVGNEIVS